MHSIPFDQLPLKMRAQTLRLTKKGNQLVPVLANLADENDAHFFGHLPATQRAELERLMKELVNHHQLKEVPVN